MIPAKIPAWRPSSDRTLAISRRRPCDAPRTGGGSTSSSPRSTSDSMGLLVRPLEWPESRSHRTASEEQEDPVRSSQEALSTWLLVVWAGVAGFFESAFHRRIMTRAKRTARIVDSGSPRSISLRKTSILVAPVSSHRSPGDGSSPCGAIAAVGECTRRRSRGASEAEWYGFQRL